MQITFRVVAKKVCITIPHNKNIINTIKNIVTVEETNNCTTSRIWDYKVKNYIQFTSQQNLIWNNFNLFGKKKNK